jgi:hypothetical protein
MIQALDIIRKSHPRYQDPLRLIPHGSQHFSQNYEDGMIAEIFRRIGVKHRTFLEIGVGDGAENNTTCLLLKGWQGWWIDGGAAEVASIQRRLLTMPETALRLTVRQALVSPGNARELLAQLRVPNEVDIFSLDIDQDTFHIWAALDDFRPRIVVVEYNSAIPPDTTWIHPYETGNCWNYTQAFGASLKAFETLGRGYGYSLVGCDLTGINAFFVRDDLVGEHFAAPFTAENHYEPPRYGLTYRWAHPSCFFSETHS